MATGSALKQPTHPKGVLDFIGLSRAYASLIYAAQNSKWILYNIGILLSLSVVLWPYMMTSQQNTPPLWATMLALAGVLYSLLALFWLVPVVLWRINRFHKIGPEESFWHFVKRILMPWTVLSLAYLAAVFFGLIALIVPGIAMAVLFSRCFLFEAHFVKTQNPFKDSARHFKHLASWGNALAIMAIWLVSEAPSWWYLYASGGPTYGYAFGASLYPLFVTAVFAPLSLVAWPYMTCLWSEHFLQTQLKD